MMHGGGGEERVLTLQKFNTSLFYFFEPVTNFCFINTIWLNITSTKSVTISPGMYNSAVCYLLVCF